LATFTRHVQKNILNTYTEWNTERGRDFQCIAAAIFIAEKMPQSMQWPSQGPLENFLSRETDLRPELRKQLLVAFKAVALMASDPEYNKGFRHPTRPSPIEFISIVLLLFARQSEFGFVQCADAIERLRKDLRKHYRQQLRMNSTLVKHTVKWINALQVSSLKSDGKGDKPISKETVVHSNVPSRTTVSQNAEAPPQRNQNKAAGIARSADNRTPAKASAHPEPTTSAAKRKRIVPISDEEDEVPISHSQLPKKVHTDGKSTPRPTAAQPTSATKKRQLARPSITPGQQRPNQGASGSVKPTVERSTNEDYSSQKSAPKPQVNTDTSNRRMNSLPNFKKKGPEGHPGAASSSQSPTSSSVPSPVFDTTRASTTAIPRTSIGALPNPQNPPEVVCKTEVPEQSISASVSVPQGRMWSFLENARGTVASPVDYIQSVAQPMTKMSPPPFSPYTSSNTPNQGRTPTSAPGTTTHKSSYEVSHTVSVAGTSDVLPPTPSVSANCSPNQRKRLSSFAPSKGQ
jgi:hypothetical protein